MTLRGFLRFARASTLGGSRRTLDPLSWAAVFHLFEPGTELLEPGLEPLERLAKSSGAAGPGLGQDATERCIGLPQGGFHAIGRL